MNDPLYNHVVFGPTKGKGGIIGKSAKKLVDVISKKMANHTIESVIDTKHNIRTDLSMSLLKSRIMGLRSTRSGVFSQNIQLNG